MFLFLTPTEVIGAITFVVWTRRPSGRGSKQLTYLLHHLLRPPVFATPTCGRREGVEDGWDTPPSPPSSSRPDGPHLRSKTMNDPLDTETQEATFCPRHPNRTLNLLNCKHFMDRASFAIYTICLFLLWGRGVGR